MTFLPWAFMTFLLSVFSGDFLSAANAKPDVFLAFVVAASFKRQSIHSIWPPFLFLVGASYILNPPDGQGEFLGFLGLCIVMPVGARFLPMKNRIEFLVYIIAACVGSICFSLAWAKLSASVAPLPPPAVLFLSIIYTVCVSTAFFIILPEKKVRRLRR